MLGDNMPRLERESITTSYDDGMEIRVIRCRCRAGGTFHVVARDADADQTITFRCLVPGEAATMDEAKAWGDAWITGAKR